MRTTKTSGGTNGTAGKKKIIVVDSEDDTEVDTGIGTTTKTTYRTIVRSPGRERRATSPPRRAVSPPRRGHRITPIVTPNAGALSPQQEKYCSCVVDVAAKQSDECLSEKGFGGGKCYNPYAVCAHSTGTTARHCSPYYDYDAMSEEEKRKLSLLKGKSVNQMKSETMKKK